jgi:hypothetical protein
MCTEKLGKAYFWRGMGAENLGHTAFVKFVQAMATHGKLANDLGFRTLNSFNEWIDYVSPLVHDIERLAPALAGTGPNPEYPWPRNLPQYAPVEEGANFQVWRNYRTPNGHQLQRMLELVLNKFEAWF